MLRPSNSPGRFVPLPCCQDTRVRPDGGLDSVSKSERLSSIGCLGLVDGKVLKEFDVFLDNDFLLCEYDLMPITLNCELSS